MPRAPKKCGELRCETRVTGRTFCPPHTPQWAGTNRKARLPADWEQKRQATAMIANGQCQWMINGQRCTTPGTDCDHIIEGDDHAQHNLQWLCGPHHRQKTIADSRARATKVRQAHADRQRGWS